MRRTIFWQSGVLVQRYSAVLLVDPFRVLLFLCQAPFAAGVIQMIGRYWSIPPDARVLWLPLAAFWCGGFASCQEIVRERAIFQREQKIGVTPLAYLLSKFRLLFIIAFLQAVLLLLIMLAVFHSSGDIFSWLLLFYLCEIVGISTGLFVSALTSIQSAAFAAIAIFVAAHLVCIHVVIASEKPLSVLACMPVGMGYVIARNIMAVEPGMLTLLIDAGVLCLWIGMCGILTTLLLRRAIR